MSQTLSDNVKVTNGINIARTLIKDRKKSKNQRNRGSQLQWISS